MMIIVGCADIVFIAFKSLWILGKSVARKFENKMQIVASGSMPQTPTREIRRLS